jgi:CheY-like chemotaxis protein
VLAGADVAQPPRPIVTRHAIRELRRGAVRILLAEDNITNQQVALGILRRLGHRVDGAANGKEALNALRSIPYDMVLMDVQMPEMDGLEATRAIRAAGGDVLNGEIPIIAMTAHAMQGDRGKCLASGMDDYIAKPVSPAALAALVEKWMVKLDGAGRSANASATDHPASPPRAADVVFAEAALLERSMGDRDLARVVAAGFLEDIPRQIGTLAGFVEAKDAKGVERQAHTIKGAAAAVSGEGVVKVAFVLEQAARAGDLDNAKATLAELHRQFDLLKQAMETSNLLVATSA